MKVGVGDAMYSRVCSLMIVVLPTSFIIELMCGSAVMGVQHEQEGVEHTALWGSGGED